MKLATSTISAWGVRTVASGQWPVASGQWPVKCEAEEIAVSEKRQNEANLLLVLISGKL